MAGNRIAAFHRPGEFGPDQAALGQRPPVLATELSKCRLWFLHSDGLHGTLLGEPKERAPERTRKRGWSQVPGAASSRLSREPRGTASCGMQPGIPRLLPLPSRSLPAFSPRGDEAMGDEPL